jgi:hypothetical protein
MTRKERICALDISEEEKNKFFNIYFEYEKNIDKRVSDSLAWRLKNLLPKSQQLLEERYKPRREVKCLFVLVGTTIEPLLLSILTIRPTEKLVLICSSESELQKNQLIATLRQICGSFEIIPKSLLSDVARNYIENIKLIHIDDNVIIENITPNKVFSSIKNCIGAYRNYDVGVDITGGKKSMVGGGFLVAAINNYNLFYIDFDEYIDDHPKPGTEYIHILDNPYDIYNIREEVLIQFFWKRQDFEAVSEVVEQVIKKLTENKAKDYGLEKEWNRLRQIQTAALCYSEWSKFHYSQALVNAQLCEDIYFNYYKSKHKDVLSVLTDCKEIRRTVYGSVLLAIDRWKRGADALVLEKFDKSALCFTQAIEILCCYRIFDMSEKGKLSGGTFGFGVNPGSGKPHSPETSGSIKFIFKGENQQSNVKIYNAGISLSWKDEDRLIEGQQQLTIDNIVCHLNIRNELAHFSCFSKERIFEVKDKIFQFQVTTKLFISLFITTYQNENELDGKCFDDLQAPFSFAKFKDFNIIS